VKARVSFNKQMREHANQGGMNACAPAGNATTTAYNPTLTRHHYACMHNSSVLALFVCGLCPQLVASQAR